MPMRDIRYRAVGLGFLIASGITTLVHRAIFAMVRHGPAQIAELAIGLLTFMLASVGGLLVIHGSRLFTREQPRRSPASDADRQPAVRDRTDPIYGSTMRKREFDLE